MRKVITINLNNNAYQIDEDGYEALRAYLDSAARKLATNPDRAEILVDLEQAIGDKCRACLGPHKSVVSSAEILRILEEMGPVEGNAADEKPAGFTNGSAPDTASAAPGVKRLYRIGDGAMWAGVCNGLAAYVGIDVVWMRLIFILLTVCTGVWLVVYIALIFIMPRAETAEQMAAARGATFNAQELIDRLKKKPEGFRSRRAGMTRSGFGGWRVRTELATPPGAAARVTGGLFLPVLTVMSAVWFAAMLCALFVVWSVYEPGGIAAWGRFSQGFWWSPEVPRWIAVIAILAVYALLAMPIGAGRRASLYYANGGRLHGWADAWSGLLWLALVAMMLWAAWYAMPGVQELLRGVFNGTRTVFV